MMLEITLPIISESGVLLILKIKLKNPVTWANLVESGSEFKSSDPDSASTSGDEMSRPNLNRKAKFKGNYSSVTPFSQTPK